MVTGKFRLTSEENNNSEWNYSVQISIKETSAIPLIYLLRQREKVEKFYTTKKLFFIVNTYDKISTHHEEFLENF